MTQKIFLTTIAKQANRLAIILKEIFMSERLYTQREVSGIFLDVPNKTLIYWARQGLVEWVAETRDARGIARLYNRWNLFQIAMVRELTTLGLSLENISGVMNRMFKDYPPGENRYTHDDEGRKVLKGLASEFFSSESRLNYLIIVKGSGERGWPKTIVTGLSNLTEQDSFQLRYGWLGKSKDTGKSRKFFDTIITTYVLIELDAIDEYVTSCIEKAGLK
jgi:DNA-binding transcriptional MerR regulator